ncbi:hypothetical protein [Halomonas sp. WWR20]
MKAHHVLFTALLLVSPAVMADDTLSDKARRAAHATGELLGNAGEAVIVTGRRALDGTREGLNQGADWTQRLFTGDAQGTDDARRAPQAQAAPNAPPPSDPVQPPEPAESGVRVTPMRQ